MESRSGAPTAPEDANAQGLDPGQLSSTFQAGRPRLGRGASGPWQRRGSPAATCQITATLALAGRADLGRERRGQCSSKLEDLFAIEDGGLRDQLLDR